MVQSGAARRVRVGLAWQGVFRYGTARYCLAWLGRVLILRRYEHGYRYSLNR